jgi:transglutaminase-like putative cysteine protease
MQYDIRLKIEYSYASRVSSGRHLLRLMPQSTPQQRRISGLLSIDPVETERVDRHDFFGNEVVEVTHLSPHSSIAFMVSARVERSAPFAPMGEPLRMADLHDEIQQVRSLDSASPHHFLAASPRIGSLPVWRDYTRSIVDPSATVRAAVEALGLTLNRDMTFDPKMTTVDTLPEEAFARRVGVCQDYSQIMIGCLRAMGIPASYMSGFLRTEPPPGKKRLQGADAMHAWVCAWAGPGDGWIEYDPTNATFVTTDHISIGRGRDYSDVSPVRGTLKTAGKTTTSQAVDVIPLDGSL